MMCWNQNEKGIPRIINATTQDVTGGTITCTSFVAANGKVYYDWIPAIKLV